MQMRVRTAERGDDLAHARGLRSIRAVLHYLDGHAAQIMHHLAQLRQKGADAPAFLVAWDHEMNGGWRHAVADRRMFSRNTLG